MKNIELGKEVLQAEKYVACRNDQGLANRRHQTDRDLLPSPGGFARCVLPCAPYATRVLEGRPESEARVARQRGTRVRCRAGSEVRSVDRVPASSCSKQVRRPAMGKLIYSMITSLDGT
jgi:hypothetical protein